MAKPRQCLDQDFLPFAVKSVARMLVPVMLPPGRASEFTTPDPTISSVLPRMGIVVVACCAARIAVSPVATMNIDLGFYQLRCKFRNQINARSNLMPIDGEVLAFNEARSSKFIKHYDPNRRTPWACGQAAYLIGPPSVLRACSERPRYRRACN